ncbi:MAG: carboxypeptidase regulatory-like domain-containing protein, partial [Deltaproteobacteria bacterium]|nr:carboxypeptidase regulatory-like domain-containing protein [Deltaproteobacteria bacterium]
MVHLRPPSVLTLAAAIVAVVAAASCNAIFGVDDLAYDAGGGANATAGSGGGGSTSTGG